MSGRTPDGCSDDCARVVRHVSAFIDLMLPADEHTAVATHLATCPSCQQIERVERAGSSLLRAKAPALKNVPLPPGLRTRCAATVIEAAAPRAASGWAWLRPAVVIVALLGVTATALVVLGPSRSTTLLAAELVADHLKCFALFESGTGRSANPALVKAMLRDRYGWDVDVPGSSGADNLRLDGARRCLYGDGPIPHVMYQAHGQNVSLFVLEGRNRATADLTVLGHRAKIWTRGGTTYVMVASTAAGTLSEVAGYLARETH
jgi:anti-sigma factor RsiW